MPIPSAPSGRTDIFSTLLRLFQQVHDQVRHEIEGLDDGLNWVPIAGTNSIATIVTHLVGSEAETLQCVAGITFARDRDNEFSHAEQNMSAVTARIDAADRLLTEVQPLIDQERLDRSISLPTLPPDEQRSGLTWLVGNYGHAREHIGQIQMTRQLFRAHQ